MFICVGRVDDSFTVIDTSDKVREVFCKDDLLGILEQGIEIAGVTVESLSIDECTTILVDFNRTAGLGKYFNGFYFEEYSIAEQDYFVNPYMFSILGVSDVDLCDILPFLQEANGSILNNIYRQLKKAEKGYVYIERYNDSHALIEDCSNHEYYSVNYCEMVGILMSENKSIDGIEDINSSFIKMRGETFKISDAVTEVVTAQAEGCDYICEISESDSSHVLALDTSLNGVSRFISEHPDCYLSNTYVPIVDCTKYECAEDSFHPYVDNAIKFYNTITTSAFIKREGDLFIFENGNKFTFSEIQSALNMLEPDEPLYKEASNYVSAHNAKEKLLKGDKADMISLTKPRVFNFNHQSENMLPYISDDVDYEFCSTAYGGLMTATYIRNRDIYGNSCDSGLGYSSIGGLDIFRVTYRGQFIYSFRKGGVTLDIGNVRRISRSSRITGYVLKHLDEFGYLKNNAIPIMVNSVNDTVDGLEVNVAVFFNTNGGHAFEDESWGMIPLVVPLPLTGVRHYFIGDFVVFEMLFQDLIMTREAYDNLYVSVDEFNDFVYLDGCTKVTSAKFDNCGETSKTTKAIVSFKNITKGEMRVLCKRLGWMR